MAAELCPDREVTQAALAGAREHAEHIAAHLEWADGARGNHYLANLVGLLWAASHLPADARSDALFAFAASELLREGELTIRRGRGNHEGSTNYHRLSAEILRSASRCWPGWRIEDLQRIDNARADAVRLRPPWRAGPLPRHPLPDGSVTVVPPAVRERLFRAAEMIEAATRPDGRVTQIGDTDSGRLFRLTPVGTVEGANDPTFHEDTLDHRATAEAIRALFAAADGAQSLDAVAIARIAGGRRFPRPDAIATADHGDLDAVIATIEAWPAESRRCRRLAFGGVHATWGRAAFPRFGLYVFREAATSSRFAARRRRTAEAPLGHTHDDNLAIEYVLGDATRTDPGTFCYTPSRMLRDAYRGCRRP